MARQGYKIFDADTHLYEPVEHIEAYLAAADRARLDALAPLVKRTQVKDGMSRYRIGERPPNDRLLGSLERVALAAVVTQGLKDNATSVAEVRRCGNEDWPVGIFPPGQPGTVPSHGNRSAGQGRTPEPGL